MPEPKVTDADNAAAQEFLTEIAEDVDYLDAPVAVSLMLLSARFARARAEGRAAGIEEAAKVCDDVRNSQWGGAESEGAAICAAAIRDRKDRP